MRVWIPDVMTVFVDPCATAVQVNAGTVATNEPLCSGESFTATTTGAALFDGDVLGYVLHLAPSDNVLNPATHIAFNNTGTFTNTNINNVPLTYYVTAIAANNDGAGLPDLTDECLALSSPVQVIYLAPLNLPHH